MTDDSRPLDTLEKLWGTVVTVQLKDGLMLEGVLEAYDQHMNLVLVEDTETTIVRGDNVVKLES